MKFGNTKRTIVTALMIIGVVVGTVGVVSAATITVSDSNTDDAANGTASTIDYAVTNAADGDTIELADDNYTMNSTVMVETNNLTVMSADGTEVTLNATNTSEGMAFNTSNVSSFTLGGNVVVESGGGGLFGGSLSSDGPLSTPVMVFLGLMVVGAYWYVKEE